MTTQEAIMTTQEVANRFNQLAQENKWMEIQDELYSDDAASIEPPMLLPRDFKMRREGKP